MLTFACILGPVGQASSVRENKPWECPPSLGRVFIHKETLIAYLSGELRKRPIPSHAKRNIVKPSRPPRGEFDYGEMTSGWVLAKLWKAEAKAPPHLWVFWVGFPSPIKPLFYSEIKPNLEDTLYVGCSASNWSSCHLTWVVQDLFPVKI